jgi:hypothetical protein
VSADARQRLDDLSIARATEGLGVAEAAELNRLLAAHPYFDAGAYERAAAAVCLAVLGNGRAMPRTLRARLERVSREMPCAPRTRG